MGFVLGCSTKRRLAAVAALPALLLSLLTVGAADAKQDDPSDDPRCDAPPIQIDSKSETNINPLGGTRIVLTRADCRESSKSSTEPAQSSERQTVRVTVESGTQEFVAFVGRFVDDRASEGSTTRTGASKSIQQMQLHLPIAGDRICVAFDDGEDEREVCLPPR